jgi:hypothetical protein
MDVLCERQRKLSHKEIQSQDFYSLTYEDIQNISRSNHKVRSYQLLPLPTNIEETREVQALKISKELFLLVNVKYCDIFLQNQSTV